MVIINDLSQKADKYKNSTNHHITTYYYAVDSNGEKWIKSEEFRLDDKIKSKVTEISDDGIIIETQYKNDKVVNDGFGVNTYLETTNGKFVCFNYTNSGPYNSLNNPLLENKFKTNNFFELFKLSVKSNIDNATYNGKECYYITNFENYRPQGVYVNKDIGMPTRENSSESTYENGRVEKKEIIDVIYDFDTVTEEDFIEPNSSEYKIVEDLSQIE